MMTVSAGTSPCNAAAMLSAMSCAAPPDAQVQRAFLDVDVDLPGIRLLCELGAGVGDLLIGEALGALRRLVRRAFGLDALLSLEDRDRLISAEADRAVGRGSQHVGLE